MIINLVIKSACAAFLFLILAAYSVFAGPSAREIKELSVNSKDLDASKSALENVEAEPPMTMLSEQNRQFSPSDAKEFERQTK